ncbi:MAG: precorrin-4 C(11)-methyltransferase [Chloroflexota bacterium]
MDREPSVYFIGAGPGALDLLTVRAQRILGQADLILYADSLVNLGIASLAKAGAEVAGSSGLTLAEIVGRMVQAARAGRIVARVHSGDPSLYGATREQMAALQAAGVGYEVVPGVSSLFAAAAVLGVELTMPEVSQTVIIGRAEGRTPVPDRQKLRELASHRATMAIYLSAGMIERVVAELLQGGYQEGTPAAVVYRATWPDQRILRGTLSSIPEAVRTARIDRQALILVGDALAPMNDQDRSAASLLYDPAFGHGYRKASGP